MREKHAWLQDFYIILSWNIQRTYVFINTILVIVIFRVDNVLILQKLYVIVDLVLIAPIIQTISETCCYRVLLAFPARLLHLVQTST